MGNQNATGIQDDKYDNDHAAESTTQGNVILDNKTGENLLTSSTEHTKVEVSDEPLEEASDPPGQTQAPSHSKEEEKPGEVQPLSEPEDQSNALESSSGDDIEFVSVPAVTVICTIDNGQIQEDPTRVREQDNIGEVKPLSEPGDQSTAPEGSSGNDSESESVATVTITSTSSGNDSESESVPTVTIISTVNYGQIQDDPARVRDNEGDPDSGLNQKYVSNDSEASEYKEQDIHNDQPVQKVAEGFSSETFESHFTTLAGSSEFEREISHSQVTFNVAEDLTFQEVETNMTEDAVEPAPTLHPKSLYCEREQSEFVEVKYDQVPKPDKVDVYHSIDIGGKSDHGSRETIHISEVSQACPVEGSTVPAEEKIQHSNAEEPYLLRGSIPVNETIEPITSSEHLPDEGDIIALAGVSRVLKSKSLTEDKMLIPMDQSMVVSGNERETDDVQGPQAVSNEHEEIIEVNEGNFEGQIEEIKEVTENLANLPNVERYEMIAHTDTSSNEQIISHCFKDKDDLLDKNIIAYSESKQDNSRYHAVTQASEIDSTKSATESFIFTDESTSGNLLLLNGHLLIQRCPSFNFDLKNGAKPEESNHTPLLYHSKHPMRSLSSPGTAFFSAPFAGNDQNDEEYHDTSFKEKTIILDRSDSEKSRTPLLGFGKDEEATGVSMKYHQEQDSFPWESKGLKDMHNGHSKDEVLELPKGRQQKDKPRPSFFSSCVCCTGIDQLNADI